MSTQKICSVEDKPFLRGLWKECFGDSDSFLDFYFDKRFYPEFTVCTIEDSKVVNAMYSLPVNMRIRGNIVPAAMLAGFSTDKEYRGRGYMSGAFKMLINNLSNNGIAIAPHTPVIHERYFNFENYTSTDTKFISGIAEKPKIMPVGVNFGRMVEVGRMFCAYSNFANKYSGTLARSIADFRLKFDDLESDGGEFIIAEKKGKVGGYALYYNGIESLSAIEVVYCEEEIAESLCQALAFIADNKPLKIKLPADCMINLQGCESKVIPHGVAAPVDLSILMKAVFKDENMTVKLSDSICDKNNCVLYLNGDKACDEVTPDIEVSAGYFLQFAEGYKSLDELNIDGHLMINNSEIVKEIDLKYPKIKCFICDEY